MTEIKHVRPSLNSMNLPKCIDVISRKTIILRHQKIFAFFYYFLHLKQTANIKVTLICVCKVQLESVFFFQLAFHTRSEVQNDVKERTVGAHYAIIERLQNNIISFS